jgi:hypothetical protein
MKIYLCMSYRGLHGDQATAEDIQLNIQKALASANLVRKMFPSVEVYVPHLDPDLQQYNEAWLRGEISSDAVMTMCIQKLSECDMILVNLGATDHEKGFLSDGMKQELEWAVANDKWYCVVNCLDNWGLEQLAMNIMAQEDGDVSGSITS